MATRAPTRKSSDSVGNHQTCEQLFGTGSTYDGNGYREFFVGNAASRAFGWHRRQLGIALRPAAYRYRQGPAQQDGDETKLFSFNVGTQF
jgi:hypothetical protein